MAAIGTLPVLLDVGTHAGRPAASAVGIGGLYSCTDHSLIYQTDGASWSTWANLAGTGGSVATDAIWDAKGDLAGGTGANTAARLAVGANGRVLMAASGEATGLEWAAPPQTAAYRRSTGDYTTTSATFVDVDGTNMALTITTRARRVLIGFTGSAFCSSASSIAFDFTVDGTRVGGDYGLQVWNVNHANQAIPIAFTYLTDALSAGSHTFKVQYLATGGSTATIEGAATGGSWAQFYVAEQGS